MSSFVVNSEASFWARGDWLVTEIVETTGEGWGYFIRLPCRRERTFWIFRMMEDREEEDDRKGETNRVEDEEDALAGDTEKEGLVLVMLILNISSLKPKAKTRPTCD